MVVFICLFSDKRAKQFLVNRKGCFVVVLVVVLRYSIGYVLLLYCRTVSHANLLVVQHHSFCTVEETEATVEFTNV